MKGFTKSLRVEANDHNISLINIYPTRIMLKANYKYPLLKKYHPNLNLNYKFYESLNSDIKENTNVITKKAIGEKCPVCWKIFQEKCERHNCGFDGKKK